jgi:transcriptional regulator with XRE-family HTH domain
MATAKKQPGSDFGRRLEEALAEAGLSQNQLQDLAKLGKGYVSRLISGGRGQRMTPKMMFELASVLNVRAQWLFLGEGPKRNTETAMPQSDAPPREVGRTIAQLAGIPDAAIESAIAKHARESAGQSALWWLDMMRAEADELARQAWQRELRSVADEKRKTKVAAKEEPTPPPPIVEPARKTRRAAG